jgi:hypothetical protein
VSYQHSGQFTRPHLAVIGTNLLIAWASRGSRGGRDGGGARGACCSCGASVYGEKSGRQHVAMALNT